jgi:succinyl-diaminopimelate desuccinylase
MEIDKMMDFTCELVSIPSFENEKQVADAVYEKLSSFGLRPEIITSDLEHPSVLCYASKPKAKKTILLEAPLDTISPGDALKWSTNPILATKTKNDRMYGLGISDSKYALSFYSYLAKDLYYDKNFQASILLVFDASEQSGKLTGIRDSINMFPKIDAAILGYQSFGEIHIGARGWVRLRITTNGISGHTGSRKNKGNNAILAMSKVIRNLNDLEFKPETNPLFEFGSRLTVSTINGGRAVNIVPDHCEIQVDIRFTPSYNIEEIIELIGESLLELSKNDPTVITSMDLLQAQKPYFTNPDDSLVSILCKNFEKNTGIKPTLTASGPGSVGNYLSEELELPIINAFGVESSNAHGTDEWIGADEWINTKTILPAYKTLRATLMDYANS